MKIAVYGRNFEEDDLDTVSGFFNYMEQASIPYIIESNYFQQLAKHFSLKPFASYTNASEFLAHGANYLVSLGGDGTLLDVLSFVKSTNIPVMGINLGRLGFLSNIPKESAIDALDCLVKGRYRIEKRGLVELKSDVEIFEELPFALNDFTIHKRDTGSMISIATYLNGEYFNTYWADGIIVSTPTGSTAYSLSCGGPIIFPDSNNLVITPVAPHNLNIRPVVVSDNTVVSFRVEGRGNNYLISLDSRYKIIDYSKEIAIQKAPFSLNLIKLYNQNFINTLREKLTWGMDNRNF